MCIYTYTHIFIQVLIGSMNQTLELQAIEIVDYSKIRKSIINFCKNRIFFATLQQMLKVITINGKKMTFGNRYSLKVLKYIL